MSAYLIVLLELALLYFVYWFVFVREENAYEVRRPIWGVYENHADELNRDDDSVVLLFSNKYHNGVRVEETPTTPRKSA